MYFCTLCVNKSRCFIYRCMSTESALISTSFVDTFVSLTKTFPALTEMLTTSSEKYFPILSLCEPHGWYLKTKFIITNAARFFYMQALEFSTNKQKHATNLCLLSTNNQKLKFKIKKKKVVKMQARKRV